MCYQPTNHHVRDPMDLYRRKALANRPRRGPQTFQWNDSEALTQLQTHIPFNRLAIAPVPPARHGLLVAQSVQ